MNEEEKLNIEINVLKRASEAIDKILIEKRREMNKIVNEKIANAIFEDS